MVIAPPQMSAPHTKIFLMPRPTLLSGVPCRFFFWRRGPPLVAESASLAEVAWPREVAGLAWGSARGVISEVEIGSESGTVTGAGLALRPMSSPGASEPRRPGVKPRISALAVAMWGLRAMLETVGEAGGEGPALSKKGDSTWACGVGI